MSLSEDEDDDEEGEAEHQESQNQKPGKTSLIITKPSVDINNGINDVPVLKEGDLSTLQEEGGGLDTVNSNCVSPASSNGGVYSVSIWNFFNKSCRISPSHVRQ